MKKLIPNKKIKKEIKRVAKEISRDYTGKSVTFVCALSGAFMFMSELVQLISEDVDVRMIFAKVSSYGDGKTAGELKFEYESRKILPEEHVIIVDDIYDSGQTLNFLVKKYSHAKTVKTCILLQKKIEHKFDVKIDYKALDCEDKFIVGFGLDYAEKYRQLPYIAEI